MKGAGDAGPGVAAGSIIGDHHADDSLIAVFGAACAEAARLDTEATHAVRRGTMYALDDRIGQLRTDCARLAAELAAARAETETMGQRWQSEMDERMSAYCAQGDALNATHEALAVAERERDEARAEAVALRRAFHDAVIRPCGVVPESGQRFYAPADAVRAEARRPKYGSVVDRQERAYQETRAAAALDPPPRGATGPSGTRDGRGGGGRCRLTSARATSTAISAARPNTRSTC